MTWSEVTVVVVAALLLMLWSVWLAASRLDRLHRKVAASRAVLENQLVRRASVAAELASSGLLDPVSSVLVGEAAWAALSAGAEGRAEELAGLPPGLTAVPTGRTAVLGSVGPSGAPGAGGTDGPTPVGGWGTGAAPVAGAGTGALDQAERDQVESELSRTIRTALAEPDEVDVLRADERGAELVAALSAAWYRVHLARRFHNEAVVQAQRMRRKTLVRLLRLHGHAAVPTTVEIDDAWPEAFAQPGELT